MGRVLQQVPSAPPQPPPANFGRRMRAHPPLGLSPWERASQRAPPPLTRRADVGTRDRGVPTAGAGGAVRLRRAAQARQGRAGASPSCSLSESKWRQGEPGAVPEPKPLTGAGRTAAAAAGGEWPRGLAPVRTAALGAAAAEATAAVPAAAAAGGASEVSVPRWLGMRSRLAARRGAGRPAEERAVVGRGGAPAEARTPRELPRRWPAGRLRAQCAGAGRAGPSAQRGGPDSARPTGAEAEARRGARGHRMPLPPSHPRPSGRGDRLPCTGLGGAGPAAPWTGEPAPDADACLRGAGPRAGGREARGPELGEERAWGGPLPAGEVKSSGQSDYGRKETGVEL